jgi:hypothetical protein
MGPGARPIGPGSSPSGSNPPIDSIISQVREIRSHYSITLDDARANLNISYTLKDRHRSFTLPFSALPLSPSSQWLLYGGPARRLTTGTFVTDILRGAENMAARDLTQSEAEGHALHASRRMLYGFAAVASSFSIGAAFAVAGRKTMKFPLRKPKPLERYDNFPNRYLPILRGQYARAMWHITRANVYTFCAFLLLQPLYSSMGDNALTVGLYRDPRTNAVLKEMKANKDPNRAFQLSRISSNVEKVSSDERKQVFSQTAKQREGLERQRGGKPYEDPDPQGYYNDTTEGVVNDYSGGRSYESPSDAGDRPFADGNGTDADSGMLTDRQMAVREAKQSNAASTFTGVPAYQRGVQQKTQQQQAAAAYSREQESGADGFMFDDTSPSGGRGMREDLSAAQPITKSGVGGAWSRVRRGEQTPHPHSEAGSGNKSEEKEKMKPSRSRGASSADSFSFAGSEEERQAAKERAQREFDGMVEAERKGMGVGGGGGAGGGGSAWGGRPSGRGGL